MVITHLHTGVVKLYLEYTGSAEARPVWDHVSCGGRHVASIRILSHALQKGIPMGRPMHCLRMVLAPRPSTHVALLSILSRVQHEPCCDPAHGGDRDMSQRLHPQGTIRETRIERLIRGLPRDQATYMFELPNRVVVCLFTATLVHSSRRPYLP